MTTGRAMGRVTSDRARRRWPGLLFAAAFAAQAAASAPTTLAAPNRIVASGDGFRLALTADGRVGNVRIGERRLGVVPGGGGFSVRRVGGMPNLLPNASFEADVDANGIPDGWVALNTPVAPVIDTTVAKAGTRSVRLGRPDLGDTGYLRTEIPVAANTAYTLSGWMQSSDVKPTAPTGISHSDLSPARVMLQAWAGAAVESTDFIYGYTDTAGWNRQFLGIKTSNLTTHVRVTMKLIRGSGTVWYDDLRFNELLQPTATAFRGQTTQSSAQRVLQHAELPAEKLTLDADYRASADRITVDATIRSSNTSDRPLQLAYTLPIDAVGWQFQRHARSSRTIEPGKRYAYDTRWHVQSMSRYPWSTVNDAESSLSIGLPLNSPRIARVDYGPLGLTITFDLGLSPSATRLGNAAKVRFVLFTSDAAWGFRASTAKYHALFPNGFIPRTDPERQGGWTQRKYLGEWADDMADFGLGLDMLALGSDQDGAENNDAHLLAPDNSEGVYTAGYNHHWGYKYKLPSPDAEPTYEEALEWLQDAANGPTGTELQRAAVARAKGAQVSTARDFNGRYVFERYGDKFLQYYLNLDPLPAAAMDSARAGHQYQVLNAIANAAAVDGTLDAHPLRLRPRACAAGARRTTTRGCTGRPPSCRSPSAGTRGWWR